VFKEDTISETHDLLNCRCSGTIKKIAHHIRARAKVDALENWEHIADVDTVNKVTYCSRACFVSLFKVLIHILVAQFFCRL